MNDVQQTLVNVRELIFSSRNIEAMTLLRSIDETIVPDVLKFSYYAMRMETEWKIESNVEVLKLGEKAAVYPINDENLSVLFHNMSTYAMQLQNFTLAQNYVDKCIKYACNDNLKASANKIQGRLYYYKKQYYTALKYMNIAALYADRTHNEELLFYIILEIANIFEKLEKFYTALMEVDRAEQYAKSCHNLTLFNRCTIRKAQLLYNLGCDADVKKIIRKFT